MRTFIRHPSSIQIVYKVNNSSTSQKNRMNNVSTGGISFQSQDYVEPELPISIEIPLIQPGLELSGKVIWCQKADGYHDVGVQFTNQVDEFRIRMIEQLCYIERYKQTEGEKGRQISHDEAAKEWIEKYAKDFPALL